MNDSEIKIVKMERDDLDEAVRWAATEGWNPGLFDAYTFFPTDPSGFFVAKQGNRYAGFISAVTYDSSFGFAGFFIVRKDLRKKGVGRMLIEHASSRISVANLGTDGVVEQQENYKKLGFKTAYKNLRFGGKIDAASSPNVSPISHAKVHEVIEFDSKRFPVRREAFLYHWLFQRQSVAMGSFLGGRLCGYGVIRPAHEGARIGPLFCENTDVATELIHALASRFAGQMIFIDVPEPNSGALELVYKLRLEKIFETARMYTGGTPNINLDEVFGVTSFELG